MGTRSSIAIKNADGTVEGIYCHWDGYLSHNGKLLLEHYRTEEAVRALIAPGDMSSLAESVGEKHDFDQRDGTPGQCTYYGRDRGEKDVDLKRYSSVDHYLEQLSQEYDYLFDVSDGKWHVRCGFDSRASRRFKLLTKTLIAKGD